jgi:hypothetical protein
MTMLKSIIQKLMTQLITHSVILLGTIQNGQGSNLGISSANTIDLCCYATLVLSLLLIYH